MPQLTETCDLWRMVGPGASAANPYGDYEQGKEMTAVYTRVPCLRVPVSEFDKLATALSGATSDTQPSQYYRSGARDSTDVFLLPAWITVLPEDELRRGRRIDINGNAVPYRYIVGGIRAYEAFGYQDTIAVFCDSLQ